MSLGNGRAEARVMSPQTPHSSHCATAPQSKHQLPHNQNTSCPTTKISNIWKENGKYYWNVTSFSFEEIHESFVEPSASICNVQVTYVRYVDESPWDLGLSQRWLRRILSSGMWCNLNKGTTFSRKENISTRLHGATPHQSVSYTQLRAP